MPQPLNDKDIIFPHLSGTNNFSTTLSSLRQATLSIHNRLSSIALDSEFVKSVSEAYGYPLVANERCGSWYIPPARKYASTYFKSTDGHTGEWGFSLRRLNLQLIDVVQERGGVVVVDSTRRGKSMPDALSKTVPIWCCVMNRAVFGSECANSALFTPPGAVSKSEHAQIEERIYGFVQQFLEICQPNIPHLQSKLQKPLRPIWVTQQSSVPSSKPTFTDFHPVVLCTASRRVHGAEASENGYVQGAADDHEAWANGLTPDLFWQHKDLLMNANQEELPSVVQGLLQDQNVGGTTPTLIRPTKNLYISTSNGVKFQQYDIIIGCTPEPLELASVHKDDVKHYLHLKTRDGKLGSRDLRSQLPRLINFFAALNTVLLNQKILVCCPTGKDLSVGTALAILCLFANAEGEIYPPKTQSENHDINKTLIKQRLTWITTSNPALNPSRATLQSVNAVLLESQDPKTNKLLLQFPLRLRNIEQGNNQTIEHEQTMNTAEPTIHEQEPQTFQGRDDSNIPKNATSMTAANTSPATMPIPTTIFRNLLSHQPWTFIRTLRSALPTHPSGTVTGTATFTPCALAASFPTTTLLYSEEGEFTTDSGLRFTARRKYVYQLKHDASLEAEVEQGEAKHDKAENKKCLAVHFFDDDKMARATIAEGVGPHGEGIGGLFVEMGDLVIKGEEAGECLAVNKEQHVCAEDLYTARWRFGRGVSMSSDMANENHGARQASEEDGIWWEVHYDVKGPKKDYTSSTRYVRGQSRSS